MKDGKEMNRAMRQAIDREFQQDADEVKLSIRQNLFSQPLAVRTENGMWASHSLPSDQMVDKFDPKILNRQLKINDVVRPGSAYLLTWGRRHSQALLDKLAKQFDIDVFVLGHQPQDKGWKKAGEHLIIIASNHNHGCLISVDLTQSYTVEQLVESIVPLASLS
jgi:hypothetical protein